MRQKIYKYIFIIVAVVFFWQNAFWANATVLHSLRPKAAKQAGLEGLSEEMLLQQEAMAAFNFFAADFTATAETCEIARISAGNINATFLLTNRATGQKFVIQQINPIFDAAAIDNNLQLLETAQAQARQQHIPPPSWQDVRYLSARGTSNKVYYQTKSDRARVAWRVMDFIPGDITIFDKFSEVPDADREDVARSLGAAIATFGGMLETISPMIADGSLPQWQSPLPNFHNPTYHKGYLDAIVRGEQIPLSLSRAQSPPLVSKRQDLINGYPEGPDRVRRLLEKIEQRTALVSGLDTLGSGITHGDTKINNFVFRRVAENSNVSVLLI